jgi:hypothetical protein
MQIGDRVHLRHYPSSWGTVSALDGSRFKITWHTPGRKPGQPRLRVWYGEDAKVNIRTGHHEHPEA